MPAPKKPLDTRKQSTVSRKDCQGTGKRIARWIATLFIRVEIRNEQRWAEHSDALVVANHISYLDGLLLACVAPYPLTYAITTKFTKHPVWRRGLNVLVFCGLGRYVAVDPGAPFGMRELLKRLKAGDGAMIFPEGRVSLDGQFGPLQPGAAAVALSARRSILPIRIQGLADTVFGKAKRTRLWPAHVIIDVREPIAVAGFTQQEVQDRIKASLACV